MHDIQKPQRLLQINNGRRAGSGRNQPSCRPVSECLIQQAAVRRCVRGPRRPMVSWGEASEFRKHQREPVYSAAGRRKAVCGQKRNPLGLTDSSGLIKPTTTLTPPLCVPDPSPAPTRAGLGPPRRRTGVVHQRGVLFLADALARCSSALEQWLRRHL